MNWLNHPVECRFYIATSLMRSISCIASLLKEPLLVVSVESIELCNRQHCCSNIMHQHNTRLLKLLGLDIFYRPIFWLLHIGKTWVNIWLINQILKVFITLSGLKSSTWDWHAHENTNCCMAHNGEMKQSVKSTSFAVKQFCYYYNYRRATLTQ